MKQFSTTNAAKEYGKELSKHQFEHVMIGKKPAILCGTDQAYEEELWSDAQQLVEDFCMKFSAEPISEDDCSDFTTMVATMIRDLVLKEYEEEYKIKFVDAFEEY